MKKLHPFLMALCAGAILTTASVPSSASQHAEPADATKTQDSRTSAKHPVPPHNHIRDGKGMSISKKQPEAERGATSDADNPVSTGAADTTKKTSSKKKPLRPHSHPQDGKGMYVPDKK